MGTDYEQVNQMTYKYIRRLSEFKRSQDTVN